MMRILIDECLPQQLKQWLLCAQPTWQVCTVQEAGWGSIKNGQLLRLANGLYETLITADKNMHYHQNLVGLAIAVLVFPTNRANADH